MCSADKRCVAYEIYAGREDCTLRPDCSQKGQSHIGTFIVIKTSHWEAIWRANSGTTQGNFQTIDVDTAITLMQSGGCDPVALLASVNQTCSASVSSVEQVCATWVKHLRHTNTGDRTSGTRSCIEAGSSLQASETQPAASCFRSTLRCLGGTTTLHPDRVSGWGASGGAPPPQETRS